MASQAKPASTTIPLAPSQAELRFLPNLQSKTGLYSPELSHDRATLAHVVADIASAQHERVVSVTAFDVKSGRCWDASREIATEVLHHVLGDASEVPAWCRDFLEAHLGVRAVIAAERDLAA